MNIQQFIRGRKPVEAPITKVHHISDEDMRYRFARLTLENVRLRRELARTRDQLADVLASLTTTRQAYEDAEQEATSLRPTIGDF